MKENQEYLTKQIITYFGNKRKLLEEIGKEIENAIEDSGLKKREITFFDAFSGSGVVARYAKQYANKIIANDLENYSAIINDAFLSNKEDFDIELYNKYLKEIQKKTKANPVKDGIFSRLYAPKDTNNIKEGERCFYTRENAILIDSYRKYIDEVPEEYQKYFLAVLLYEISVHANNAASFKGFYKDKTTGIGAWGGTGANALQRILGEIDISTPPALSNFNSENFIYQEDTNKLVRELKDIDIAYLDPPYDSHVPYGSNYHALTTLVKNVEPKNISKVAGIPDDWNKSAYNKKQTAFSALEDVIANLDAKQIIISYNNEGLIKEHEFEEMLKKYAIDGKVHKTSINYNAFRGSRNLKDRSLYTTEFLFRIKKK